MAEQGLKSIQETLEKIINDADLVEHKNLKSIKGNQIKNEWFYYALSYLNASKSLIDIALKENTLEAKMQIIPALYNFKHAIELSLKFLYRFSDTNFDKNHDIADLYKSVIDKLKKHSGLKLKEYIKSSKLNNIGEDQLKEVINENIDDLSAIVYKYYFQTPLTKVLKNDDYFIQDQGNELFKYPEARNVTFYFKSASMLSVPEEELKKVKRNIKKMTFIISLFFSLFDAQEPIIKRK